MMEKRLAKVYFHSFSVRNSHEWHEWHKERFEGMKRVVKSRVGMSGVVSGDRMDGRREGEGEEEENL